MKSQLKYLGIMLDQYLTFKGEIKNMLVKWLVELKPCNQITNRSMYQYLKIIDERFGKESSTIPIDRDLRKNTHRLKSPKCYLYKKNRILYQRIEKARRKKFAFKRTKGQFSRKSSTVNTSKTVSQSCRFNIESNSRPRP